MVIFKGIQLVLSIIHPLPSKADIRWRQNPRLPMGHHENKIVKTKNKNKNKIKPKKEPKAKRLPRNVRLERLYAGSPASFDEFDTSFSRKSDFISDSYTRSPLRSVDDYIIRPPNPTNLVCNISLINRIQMIFIFIYYRCYWNKCLLRKKKRIQLKPM